MKEEQVMKTIRIIFLLLILTAAFTSAVSGQPSLPVYSAEEAKDHVDQNAIVEGTVFQVFHSSKSNTVFFNIGGKFPNNPFSAVIFSGNLHLFPPVSELKNKYENKIIRVTGKIKLFKGKPEIVLETPAQLSFPPNSSNH
jgi:DNA/RNA endonuclease YhcR with UshA esterase domain